MPSQQMKNTRMEDTWIYEMCQKNPPAFILDSSGKPTLNFTTGPVRLSFCDNLLEAGHKKRNDPTSAMGFSTTILFTPWSDLSIMYAEIDRIVASTPEFRDKAKNVNSRIPSDYYGLRHPLRDQGEKQQYAGNTPGLMFTTLSANIKPGVVDARMNPIVDKTKVYAGVWAILAVNAYASKSAKENMGVRFGIQSCMIVADDEPFKNASAPPPREMFGAVKVDAPAVNPAQAFAPPPGGAPPAAPPVGQAAVNVYQPAPPPAPGAPPAPANPLANFGL